MAATIPAMSLEQESIGIAVKSSATGGQREIDAGALSARLSGHL
jgi:hypothetical protein